MNKQDMNKRREAATPRGLKIMFDIYAERARNAEIWDTEGRRHIDFASGVSVLNTGHLHPRLVEAVEKQLRQFMHTGYQIVPYTSYIELAEEINRIVPGDFPKKTMFLTTGAEAVENAIKIAKSATGRSSVIAFDSAFHGRTLLGMALTGRVRPYKSGFGPMPTGVYHIPFPNHMQGVSGEQALAELQSLFAASVDPGDVAAIIIEPVQGEGGFNICPPDFMQSLRQICDEHGILLIADEIQTGFGRTGKMFAMQHYQGVIPDLTTMAKSLAGGMPLSAVCGRAEIMDAPVPGGLGGTFAGNPLSIAAALEVIKVIESEQLAERANELGRQLQEALRGMREDNPRIADIRGLGAMVAVEFRDPQTHAADPAMARQVQARALEKGLLLLICGKEDNVIRFLFPLTLSDELMAEAIGILAYAIRK